MSSAISFMLTICLLLVLLLIYLKHKLSYWKRRRIPFVKPLPIVGNLKNLFLARISFGVLFKNLYEHKDLLEAPVGGIYLLHQPALIVRDPDLIKSVLIKHFDRFQNRYEAADLKNDAMGALCLPLSKFPIWWGSRKKMSEVFTSGKIKFRMYPLMLKVVNELEAHINKKLQAEATGTGAVVEVKEMFSLFTTDLTSVLHYGKDGHGLGQGSSMLRQQTLDLFDIGFRRLFDFFVIFFCPHLAGYLRAKVFSQKYANFMRDFTQEIYRERSDTSSPDVADGDLMDVLMKFQKENQDKPYHYSQHNDFIASQIAIFLLAGFETSSSVLSFILYELAKQPVVQKQLRQELQQAFQQRSTLTYEELQALPYLQQVLCEGLRMYPAAAFINRECTTEPLARGFQLTPDLFIPHGMPVYVSILGLHRDPKVSGTYFVDIQITKQNISICSFF